LPFEVKVGQAVSHLLDPIDKELEVISLDPKSLEKGTEKHVRD
jgi:hypothetical protein